MDNLDSLFEKKQYLLVASLTKDSKDPKERFLRVSSLVILSKIDEALDDIEQYNEMLFKAYPKQIMKLHFELLFSKKLFDESKLALKRYESYPYVSQEVEEYLREIKERIPNEEHPKSNGEYIPIDKVLEILEIGTDNGEISRVVFSLKNYNINIYIDSLKIFLTRSDVHPNFKTYALILLVDQKFDEEIRVKLHDKNEFVNPSKLNPPFMSKQFNEICKQITMKADKNMSVIETALHLFNCYIIDTYPNEIYNENLNDMSDCFIELSKEYLGQSASKLNEEKEKLFKKIKNTIESTPELRL